MRLTYFLPAVVISVVTIASRPASAQTGEFQTLEDAFRHRVRDAIGVDPKDITKDMGVFVTRPLAALLFSETLNRSEVSLSYSVPTASSFVPEPFDVKTQDLDDARIECSRDQFCNYGCDSQWPWEKAGCEISKEVCKDSQKFDCERRKGMAQLVSAKKIATISFKEVSVSGSASATGLRARFSPALDVLSIVTALSVSLRLDSSGYVSPEPLVVAFGCLKHEFRFMDEPVEAGDANFSLVSHLTLVAEKGEVIVSAKTDKPKVTLHFAGTPALRFVARNPLSFLACPVPYAIAAISNLTHPKDTAKKEIEVSVPEVSQRIGSLSAFAKGWELAIVPAVSNEAVGILADVRGGK